MNALRIALAALALSLTAACGPADLDLDGQDELTGTEAELGATTGRFETFVGADGKYYFHLLAGNGEKVLASQGYASLSSAKGGIDSVKTNALNPMRFLQREAVDGSRYFVLVAGNGHIIGMSEMYASASNAERGATTVQTIVTNVVASEPAVAADTHFETFKGLDGKYYFHLKANNGQIVLQSQGYSAKSSATNGINSVRTNGVDANRYEVRDAADGQSYFVLKAGNGQVIGRSELYVSKSNAARGANTVMSIIGGAK